jgi:D-alanine transaminase
VRALCHLNGQIMLAAHARIDPMDRGFMFGDSLYEGIKVLRGVPLFLGAHLERLRRGLERIEIVLPLTLTEDCLDLVAESELYDGFLYLQVTRGVAPRVHEPPRGLAPTVFMIPTTVARSPPATRPRRVRTIADPRWIHCDLKTTSLMATIFSRMSSAPSEVDEILFVGEHGETREGGNTNFFARRGDLLQTHPLDGRILPGITRSLVLELAADVGIEVSEEPPNLSHRDEWSEAFVCGTMTGVEAVIELDGVPISGGDVGPWTDTLARRLADLEDSAGGPKSG